jgi:uncharacterized zinc-type alcohol dehydrogenase-like protein
MKHQNSFDFILNTIPVGHEMDPYLGLKNWCNNGFGRAVELLKPFHGGNIIMGTHCCFTLVKKTQEMLDFCGEHNITSDIELIDMQDSTKHMIVLQVMINTVL